MRSTMLSGESYESLLRLLSWAEKQPAADNWTLHDVALIRRTMDTLADDDRKIEVYFEQGYEVEIYQHAYTLGTDEPLYYATVALLGAALSPSDDYASLDDIKAWATKRIAYRQKLRESRRRAVEAKKQELAKKGGTREEKEPDEEAERRKDAVGEGDRQGDGSQASDGDRSQAGGDRQAARFEGKAGNRQGDGDQSDQGDQSEEGDGEPDESQQASAAPATPAATTDAAPLPPAEVRRRAGHHLSDRG